MRIKAGRKPEKKMTQTDWFANQLRAAVEASGKSKTEVAERVGTTPQALSAYMYGRRVPSVQRLIEICGACGAELKIKARKKRG